MLLTTVRPLDPTPNFGIRFEQRRNRLGRAQLQLGGRDRCVPNPATGATRNAPPAPCTATSELAWRFGVDSWPRHGRPGRRPARPVPLAWSTSQRVAALDVSEVGRTPSLLMMATTEAAATTVPSAAVANSPPAHLLQLSHAAYLVGRCSGDVCRSQAYRRLRLAVRTPRCWQTRGRRPVSSAWRTGIPGPSCTPTGTARRAGPRSRRPRRSAQTPVRGPARG